MKIEYAVKLPRSVPSKARVYALAAPRATTKQLLSLADALGQRSAGAETSRSASHVGAMVGRWSLALHRASGALRLMETDRYGRDGLPEDTPFELSDRKATRVAQKFASALKLLPAGEAKVLAVTHLRQAGAELKGERSGERLAERWLDAGVVFGRSIDELPVIGPGGMAMVNVAGDGAVVGARRIWRGLGRGVATVRLQPAEWALRNFEAAVRERFLGGIRVVKAQLGYLEFGELDWQALIEPVYAFAFVAQHADVASKHVHVMHAGDKAHGKLMGARRFVAGKQTLRKPND